MPSTSAEGAPGLRDKVVLVTGAASGLGAAGVLELRRRGAHPVLVDIDPDGLHSVSALTGGSPLSIRADVARAEDCEAVVAATLERHGRIDIAWANAGIASFGPLRHTDPAAWHRCIAVNLGGTFNTAHATLPALVTSGGYLALTASVASFSHPPMLSAYAASKAAIEAMGNSWRLELDSHSVAVGVIHASWVRTPLVEEGELHPGFRRLRETVPSPLRKLIEPAQAARSIADGFERRARQIWVPGWVRWLHWARAMLNSGPAQADLRRATPDIETMYLETMASTDRAASSFGPRELARSRSPAAALDNKKASPVSGDAASGTGAST
jgi:NAD(P)-dependent dehydrogenase (short-subunit alcohol dehydrogenase family)